MSDQLHVIDELERRLIETYYGDGHQRSWSPARGWLPAAAVAAVAVIVAVVVALALLPGGDVTPSSARAALERAANASVTGPDNALGPGKEWYVRVITDSSLPRIPPATPSSGFSAKPIEDRSVRDVWMTIDGSIRTRSVSRSSVGGKPQSSSPVSTSRKAGHGLLSSPLIPIPILTYRQLRTLPTSPSRLLKVIAGIRAKMEALGHAPAQPTTRIGSSQTGTTSSMTVTATLVGRCCGSTPADHLAVADLNTIEWLLVLPVTPTVRAALYRTAASLPDVRYDGMARDSLGRPGVEISVGSGDDELRLIFDEHNGALLESSSGFGASAQASGFGPLLETIATAKLVSAGR